MSEAEHALLSASAAPRWTRCYGSVALESTQREDRSSKYAAEGTAAHALAAWLLGGSPKELKHWDYVEGLNAHTAVGLTITADGMDFEVTQDFADKVQLYVDYVRELAADDGVLLVETRVNYANWLGVPKELAWGTSDANIIHMNPAITTIDEHGWLCEPDTEGARSGWLVATFIDLKFGAGVPVSPVHNEQAMLYGGGALNEIEMLIEYSDTDIVRLVIHQPRIGDGEPSEWYITIGDLKRWLKVEAAMAAQHAVSLYNGIQNDELTIPAIVNDLQPGDKQCRFCNAKSVCPALYQDVVNAVCDDFVDLDAPAKGTIAKTVSARPEAKTLSHEALAEKLKIADQVEAWLKDVRAAAEGALLRGEAVPGFKLVRGKMGARNWADPAVAEKKLKTILGAKNWHKPIEPISPTTVENDYVKKDKISQRQWKALCDNVTQKEGGLSVARESDSRPAVSMEATADDFENLDGEADAYSHLI